MGGKNIRLFLRESISLAGFLGAFMLIVISYGFFRHPPASADHDKQDSGIVTMPYRTISTAADSEHLYAYELHKRKTMQDELPEYCAIIRNVNPKKDDYKTYCKLVIDDIVKTANTDKLIVYIYDSNEAYELYETQFLQQYRNLDTTESTVVDAHLVATYTGDRGRGCDYAVNNQLSYYENAHNYKTEQEIYRPGK